MHSRPQILAFSMHGHSRHRHHSPAHTVSDALMGIVAVAGITIASCGYMATTKLLASPTINHGLCNDAKAALDASMYLPDGPVRTKMLNDAYLVLYNPACR